MGQVPHGATHLIQLEGGVCCIVGAILEVGAHVVPHHAHVAGPGLLGGANTAAVTGGTMAVQQLGWGIPWGSSRLGPKRVAGGVSKGNQPSGRAAGTSGSRRGRPGRAQGDPRSWGTEGPSGELGAEVGADATAAHPRLSP